MRRSENSPPPPSGSKHRDDCPDQDRADRRSRTSSRCRYRRTAAVKRPRSILCPAAPPVAAGSARKTVVACSGSGYFPAREDELRRQHPRRVEARDRVPCRLAKLLMSNPAPARSRSDKATWVTTSISRADDAIPGPAPPRFPSCKAAFTFGRVTCRAGTSAKRSVLTTATIEGEDNRPRS